MVSLIQIVRDLYLELIRNLDMYLILNIDHVPFNSNIKNTIYTDVYHNKESIHGIMVYSFDDDSLVMIKINENVLRYESKYEISHFQYINTPNTIRNSCVLTYEQILDKDQWVLLCLTHNFLSKKYENSITDII